MLPANEIAKLLSSDDINVPDEEAIFQALMMWVRHDLQNRQRDLGMLLSYIRLPLLPPQVGIWRVNRELCQLKCLSWASCRQSGELCGKVLAGTGDNWYFFTLLNFIDDTGYISSLLLSTDENKSSSASVIIRLRITSKKFQSIPKTKCSFVGL